MKGFTLIEVLLAILVFSLIATVSWTALGPAGEGFVMLKDYRVELEEQQWLGKQLRQDVNYLSRSQDKGMAVISLKNDSRGDTGVDELELLVRDPMYPGLTRVKYSLDEETQMLKREAMNAWSRTHVEPVAWNLAKVESFNVEAFSPQSGWKEEWEAKPPFILPRALRVTVRSEQGEMKWDLPVFIR